MFTRNIDNFENDKYQNFKKGGAYTAATGAVLGGVAGNLLEKKDFIGKSKKLAEWRAKGLENLSKRDGKKFTTKLGKYALNHSNTIAGAGLGAAATLAGVMAYKHFKNRNKNK